MKRGTIVRPCLKLDEFRANFLVAPGSEVVTNTAELGRCVEVFVSVLWWWEAAEEGEVMPMSSSDASDGTGMGECLPPASAPLMSGKLLSPPPPPRSRSVSPPPLAPAREKRGSAGWVRRCRSADGGAYGEGCDCVQPGESCESCEGWWRLCCDGRALPPRVPPAWFPLLDLRPLG